MTRIFGTLAILSTVLLCTTFYFGLSVDSNLEPAQENVGQHILIALGAIILAMLVHSLVLTYFMGTGRWMEDTGKAYQLDDSWRQQAKRLKYRTVLAMVVCLFLMITTGAFGAAADRASSVNFQGWLGLTPTQIHFFIASLTLLTNMIVNWFEFLAIDQNGKLVEKVLAEVRRMREERGLPV